VVVPGIGAVNVVGIPIARPESTERFSCDGAAPVYDEPLDAYAHIEGFGHLGGM
jgi:hypothetical protein